MLHIKSFFQCLLLGILGVALAACGGGGSNSSSSASSTSSSTSSTSSSSSSSSSSSTPASYTVGGNVTGLSGTVVLQLNGGNSLSVTTAGGFTFSPALVGGTAYAVTVSTQPTNQLCTVSSGSGAIASANITNVAVTCVNTYAVSGTVSGLTTSGLVLQLNGANNVSVASGATSFAFTGRLLGGQAYAVTISTQPTGQFCTLANASGTISTANVSNVTVTCVSTYTVGGTISGLNASGLVLGLNAGGVTIATVSPASGSTTFIFTTTPLTTGAGYTVLVYSPNISQINQPTGQTCTLANASGSIASANVTNVAVTCVTNPTTTVSGSITGLTASGLNLTLNGFTSTGELALIETLPVTSGSTTFAFSTPFNSVKNVVVRVSSHPTGLTCIIANAPGQVGSSTNMTTPQVKCATRTTNTLSGTYKLSTLDSVSTDIAVFVTFYSDGSYVLTHNDQGPTTGPDAEYGIYNWNQSTGAFTVPVLAVDTNGPSQNDTGFSSLQSCCTVTLSRSGSTLTAVVIEGAVTETDTFTAITNVSGSLTGSWLQPNNGHGHDFVVFTGTTFMWSFTNYLTSLNSTNNPAFYNGIENACYTATSSVISPTLSGCFVTTRLTGVNANGNPGFFNSSGALNTNGIPTSYSISGDTMTWTYSNGNTQTLTRITN